MDHDLAHMALETLIAIVNLATLFFAKRAHAEAKQVRQTLHPPPLPLPKVNP